MSAGSCPQCNLAPAAATPTKEEWVANWPIIKELYFVQGKTLPEVRQHMHEHHDFHAKERQYKTRFNKERHHSKRLRGEHYQAMVRVYESEKPLGASAHFVAWRGSRRVIVTIQQIYKELGRSRNRDRGLDFDSNQSLDVNKAVEILSNAQIELVISTDPSATSNYSIEIPKIEGPPSLDGSDSATSVGSPPSVGPFSPKITPHSRVDGHLSRQSSGERQLSLVGMENNLKQLKQQGSSPCQYDMFGFPMWDPFDASNSLQDLDVIRLAPPTRDLPAPNSPMHEAKRMVTEWADPWVQEIINGPGDGEGLSDYKRRGIRSLEFILTNDPANVYTLPCLNHMCVVLTANDRGTELEEFLTESCSISSRVSGDSIHMTSLFHYTLAVHKDDDQSQRLYGARLPATYRFFLERHGERHAGTLVASYYLAWHLLERGEYDEVDRILHPSLEIVERVMGKNNLLSVNCLAILARAYALRGIHRHACTLFETALRNLERRPHLEAYRLLLKVKLAKSEGEAGSLDSALQTITSAVRDRVSLFGYYNQLTWAAIQTHYDLLAKAGRHEEARVMDSDHRDACARQWYQDENVKIPDDYRDADGTVVWSSPRSRYPSSQIKSPLVFRHRPRQ